MYAIRQISTGWWMPRFSGRAGGTYEEPKPNSIPRLFRREQDAKTALDWWARGKVTPKYDYEGEFVDLVTTTVPERDHRDMEVVRITIKVESLS